MPTERLCPAVLDRADATAVQVRSVTHRTRFAEALRLGLESLRELGIAAPVSDRLAAELDHQFGSWYRWLDHTEAAGDLARPDLTDPTLLAASGLISATLTAAFFLGDPATVAWLGLEALRICLEHGLAPALVVPVAYTAFGAVVLRGDCARSSEESRSGNAARYWWTERITDDPSPTAAATRFIDPTLMSPAANSPSTEVS